MKLLVDGNVYRWQRNGGISRVFNQILPRLIEADPDLNLYVIVANPANCPIPATPRCHIITAPNISLPLKPWRLWHKVQEQVNNLLMIKNILLIKPDVFISTYYTLPSINIPSVCVIYDMIPEKFPEWFSDQYSRHIIHRKTLAVKSAKKIICISENTKKDLIEMLHVPSEKCTVVYPAQFVSSLAEENSDSSATKDSFFLYVGDYKSKYKNFECVLKAMALLASTGMAGLKLYVVTSLGLPSSGDQQRYSAIFPQGSVEFVESCSDAFLGSLYRKCLAYVCPSFYEGFGIPLVEALSYGAPVACSHTSAMPEICGDVAHYFDPLSPRECAEAMRLCVAEGRADGIVKLRKERSARYSWDESAKRYLSVIKSVL